MVAATVSYEPKARVSPIQAGHRASDSTGVGVLMGRPRSPSLALIVLCLGTFMVFLDATIVNVSIPSMIDSLHAPSDQVLWVVNACLLVYAALLIPAGRIGKLFGPGNLFALGLGVFVAAPAALRPGAVVRRADRARWLEGLGAALLSLQALVIITGIFPAGRRGAAFGSPVGMGALAALVVPTVRGPLVTDLGWRWIFFVTSE